MGSCVKDEMNKERERERRLKYILQIMDYFRKHSDLIHFAFYSARANTAYWQKPSNVFEIPEDLSCLYCISTKTIKHNQKCVFLIFGFLGQTN